MPSSVLVTGAAGFIGSHTVERLLSAGHRVVGVDNLRTGHLHNLDGVLNRSDFTFHRTDILDTRAMEEICQAHRFGALVHLAGLVSVSEAQADPDLNFELNIRATHQVADLARRFEIPRIVFASSAATYGDHPEMPLKESFLTSPIGMYGAAKLASEKILHGFGITYGLEVICLRYFNVYGTRQDPKSPYSGVISIFSRCFAEGNAPTVFGDGSQSRDFISVKDVARANMLAATLPGLPSVSCNVCTGRSQSINDIIPILRKAYGSQTDANYSDAREGDILHSLGDPSQAAKVLEFEAKTTLEDGLSMLAKAAAKDLSARAVSLA